MGGGRDDRVERQPTDKLTGSRASATLLCLLLRSADSIAEGQRDDPANGSWSLFVGRFLHPSPIPGSLSWISPALFPRAPLSVVQRLITTHALREDGGRKAGGKRDGEREISGDDGGNGGVIKMGDVLLN